MRHTVALFGEAEKGPLRKPHILQELPQLIDLFGNPPSESEGLYFAIQTLLFQRELIFFRIENEGLNLNDYLPGFKYLQDKTNVKRLHALCIPGVGDPVILDASKGLCETHNSLLITSQKDLYDYLTHR